MIPFHIPRERKKGPQTPNFRKLSVLLRSKTPPKKTIDRESVMLQHGAVGTKMIFVCEYILCELERLNGELKAWRDEGVVYIDPRKFYDNIFTLDVYVFELYSIFDYIALEIGQILQLKKKTRKNGMVDIEYFSDLSHRKLTHGKNFGQTTQVIQQKAKKLESQPWFKYFRKLRNRIVHRLPISFKALVYGESFEFPFLPDDPLDPNSPSEKRLNPLKECQKWLKETFSFIDEISNDLGRELFDGF